jgi:hypothetical protein
MVGQRNNGTFQNVTGGDRWIMAEEISDNYRTRFYLDVDSMNNTGDGTFTMNATESGDFAGLSNPLSSRDGWRLTMNITTSDELILNMTDVSSGSLEFSSDSEENTADISGNETVVVDVLNETVNGGSGFPSGTSVSPENADGFIFEDASNGVGTYDFRFDGGATGVDFRDGGRGPCDHPDRSECRGTGSTEKHAVGVVHNTTSDAVELDYVSRSTSYESTVEDMTLDAEDVNLNEIENVDGNASFNIEILATNSPEQENTPGGEIEIKYEVKNTGTVNGTQDINLSIPGAGANPSNINNNSDLKLEDGEVFTSDSFSNVTWNVDSVSDKNGTYTAFVVSENSTTGERAVDSVVISVDESGGDPGIPDSPVGFALPSWDAVAEAAFAGEVSGR